MSLPEHNFLDSYTHWQKLSRSDADMTKLVFSSTRSCLSEMLHDVNQSLQLLHCRYHPGKRTGRRNLTNFIIEVIIEDYKLPLNTSLSDSP